MKLAKNHGFGVLILVLLILPTIYTAALSSWPVQKDDQLNFSLSVQFYDENNTLTEDASATIVIIIKDVGNNLTYDITCDVNVKVGDWGNTLKEHVEGSNLTSADNFLSVPFLGSEAIFEGSAFTDKENDWATYINKTEEIFWVDAFTFTTYSAEEITNMDFSSSSNAYGYEITASWAAYENLHAGDWFREKLYSEEGILLKFKETRHWIEKSGGFDWSIENEEKQAIPGLPISIFSIFCILGIAVIFFKKSGNDLILPWRKFGC
ncbi:MAG: hypothetical protein ACTSYI_12055 [Promethearchaeota archaeon]